MTDYYAYDAGLPCRNPHCKSNGHPHPNCKCYSGAGSEAYADGGVVCSGPHKQDCEYYASGGEAHMPAHPSTTLGHAAAHHGLLGILKNIGKTSMADPESHHKTLEKAKIHLAMNEHDKASDLLHGHPMTGSVGKEKLHGLLKTLSPAMLAQESDPEAMRASVDYLHSAVKGHDSLSGHSKRVIGNDKLLIGSDEKDTESLKSHLDDLQKEPHKMLEVGGKLGHYLPEHAAEIGAFTATATQYFQSIKPKPTQVAPLDEPVAPDKTSMEQYHRQVDLAQHPMTILHHVKNGTIHPQDIVTIGTLYPKLLESMKEKAGEAIIEAKTKKQDISYRQKQGLSALLGQPLDFTQTPMASMAIIKSAGIQQAKNQEKKNSGPKKASGVELKQVNKVNEMAETPLEARQINKKSR